MENLYHDAATNSSFKRSEEGRRCRCRWFCGDERGFFRVEGRGGGGSSRVGHCVGLLDAGSSRSGGNLAVSPPQQIQPRPRKQACGGGAKKAADENRSEKNKVEEGHKKGRDEEDEGKKLYSSTHLSESATATGAVKWGFRRAPTQVWPVVVIKLDARRETGASHHFRIRSGILLPILSRGIKDGG